MAALSLAGCRCEENARAQPAIPSDSLQTADLALRLGRSIESEAIASCGGGARYSHAGIIIRRDTAAVVIHIEPSPTSGERVRCDAIDDFFSHDRASAGAVMRMEGITDAQRHTIASYASALAGSEVVFDHSYSMSDTTRMYCTELVERAYAAAGIRLSQGRRHWVPLMKEPVIMPSDITGNDSLTTIWSYRNYNAR